MKPRPKPSSEQVEASGAPVSPEIVAGAPPQGAVLGVGLLAANRGRE